MKMLVIVDCWEIKMRVDETETIPGLLWLGYKIESFDNALVFGLYPFIVGDLIKLYVAAIALPGAWAIIGQRR